MTGLVFMRRFGNWAVKWILFVCIWVMGISWFWKYTLLNLHAYSVTLCTMKCTLQSNLKQLLNLTETNIKGTILHTTYFCVQGCWCGNFFLKQLSLWKPPTKVKNKKSIYNCSTFLALWLNWNRINCANVSDCTCLT